MSLALVLTGAVLAALSGLGAAALRRTPARAQRVTTAALVAGAGLGLLGALAALVGPVVSARAGWSAPFAALAFRLDPLSALFLVPVFAIPAAGSIYGLAYYPQASHGLSSVRLQVFYGLVTGAMAVLTVADTAVLFLAAWEVMALSGFVIVLTEHTREEVQRSAFVYLAAAHVGTLALFALFALLGSQAGSFDFARIAAAHLTPGPLLFGLLFLGFGLKAGLMPLHFWLPGAHASAPSHVSAVMSGVLLKMGIYGFLRVAGFFPSPPLALGFTVLGLGAISAVLGVAFALAQHDLKRLLAYHSVENIGIITLGFGLALLGRSAGDPSLVMLGLGGAVLHVLNHALFKGLLFFGAGAVDEATGTREIDRLGGLARAMPLTFVLFLLGAVAISGLPPLNGFVSEWLVYLGTLRALGSSSALAWSVLAAPVLALVGGLAAACFAKVVGIVFLGSARSPHGADAREAGKPMLRAMAILAAGCVLIGLFPGVIIPALHRAAAAWAGLDPALLSGPARSAASSAGLITASALALLALVGALAAWRARRTRGAAATETWGCGYSRPTPRMQYTGSSFAEMLTLRFAWAFFPRAEVRPPQGPFPAGASFGAHVPDTVLEVLLIPALKASAALAEKMRRLHSGLVQGQALLVAVTLVLLLSWRFLFW